MRGHMKRANELRASIGGGPFTQCPKVTDSSLTEYHFPVIDSLENHGTDDESGAFAAKNSGLNTLENVRFAAGSNPIDYHESYTNPGPIPYPSQSPQFSTSELMTEACIYYGTDIDGEMDDVADGIIPTIRKHNGVSAPHMINLLSSDVDEREQMEGQEYTVPPDDDLLMPISAQETIVNPTTGSLLKRSYGSTSKNKQVGSGSCLPLQITSEVFINKDLGNTKKPLSGLNHRTK